MSAPEKKTKRARKAVKSVELVQIPVIRIINPFNAREFVREELTWSAKKSIADYFPQVPGQAREVVISISGRIVPKQEMACTYLDRTDNVVLCPVPHGGGDGKSILGIIAMVAIAVFAPQALVGMSGAMGATVAGVTTLSTLGTITMMGVMVAGSMLVQGLLAPSTSSASASSMESSSSYGIDGAKNTSVENIPVPVCYGRFRFAGNLLNVRVDNTDTDTQILYMLVNAGEGPIDGISDIEINDVPISRYQDVEVHTRMGDASQSMIPWFGDTITPVNIGKELTTDWQYHMTDGEVDKLRIDFVAPNGLFGVNRDDGKDFGVTVDCAVEYRKVGVAAWSTMPSTREIVSRREVTRQIYYIYEPGKAVYWRTTEVRGTGQEVTLPYYRTGSNNGDRGYTYTKVPHSYHFFYKDTGVQITNPSDLDYLVRSYVDQPTRSSAKMYLPLWGSVMRISDLKKSAVRRSFMSNILSEGRYEVRFRRVTANNTASEVQDTVYLSDINEIITDDVAYNNTALLAIKVRLSEQLNGLPTVTFAHGGKMINAWEGGVDPGWVYGSSESPAWIVWDMLTSRRYGAGMPESRLDFVAFKEWAAYCALKGLTFNGVFDSEMNAWDAAQLVFRVGHAQIVGIGTRFTVVVEKPADPVMMFTVANMVEGTFKETWLGMADRANEIEVTYFDEKDKNKERTVRVVDYAAQQAGDRQRTASIVLYGVVDNKRAYDEGQMQLNMNRYIHRTVEFGAPMEAIACTVGDLIYVQHDMPQWGFAGRTAAGSTKSVINIDRDVEMEGGKQYKLMLIYDAIERASGSIVNIIGTSLILSNWDGVARVKRLQSAGRDVQVLSTFDAGGGLFGVVLDDVTGMSVGHAFSLWDTDVIEERDVRRETGNATSLTVLSPFSQAPDRFVNYMFGEVGKIKKPFRVKAINGSHEYRRDIVAIEYNASVYELGGVAVPTPNYSSLDKSAQHAVVEATEEGLVVVGTKFRSNITVHFRADSESYAGADVFAMINDNPWVKIATNVRNRASVMADDGDLVTFKVVARDVLGVSAPDNTAPTKTHTVVGKLAPPADVTGFTVEVRTKDLLLKWDTNTDIDLRGYEVRHGASWDAGVVITTNFAGTMITHDQDKAGTYRYHIRAIDTGGRYSAQVTSYTLQLEEPETVSYFDCVQSNGRIEFRWRANVETNIDAYEIREGQSWGASQLVGQVSATSHSIPAGVTGGRRFWIKAIASPGIYGKDAAFCNADVAQASNVNLILHRDEHAAGFPGQRHFLNVLDDDLVMAADVKRSEYLFKVDLGETRRAQNSMSSEFGSVSQAATMTWAEANFKWKASAAARQWIPDGSLSAIQVRYQIAPNAPLGANELYGFSLDESLESVDGVLPTESAGVSYESGRYSRGLYVQGTTTVSWAINLPPVFHVTFWVIPKRIQESVYWSVTSANSVLRLGYSEAAQGFYVEDGFGNRITVPFDMTVEERICIGIAQTATARKLFVGSMNGAAPQWAQGSFAPQGSYSKLQLY